MLSLSFSNINHFSENLFSLKQGLFLSRMSRPVSRLVTQSMKLKGAIKFGTLPLFFSVTQLQRHFLSGFGTIFYRHKDGDDAEIEKRNFHPFMQLKS